jgi:putative sigma-54 modulation protein
MKKRPSAYNESKEEVLMKLHIHGQNLSITEGMLQKTEKKLSFLEKFILVDEDTTANVQVKIKPNTLKVEITILTKVGIIRAEVEHADYYAAIDLAIDKLEDQLRRLKTRLNRKHREKLSKAFMESDEAVANEPKAKVVKTKTVLAEEMSLDDAILRMEMLGHSFFIYTDEEHKDIAVVYKRLDGGYGLLETQKV